MSKFTLPHVSLVILRLEDVCVRVQDDMDNYLRTAALEPTPGAEACLKWLRKRGCEVGLLSDASPDGARLVLNRLGWGMGPGGLVQHLVGNQATHPDPIADLLAASGPDGNRRVCSVFDTPRLLALAAAHRPYFNLGVTNGRCPFETLAAAPAQHLLDNLVQLPNFLLQHLPEGRPLLPLYLLPLPK